MRSLKLSVSLLLSLATSLSCTTFRTSDFGLMVRLPASRDCVEVKVMSGKQTRFPVAQCDDLVARGVFMTSESWKLLRGDIQTNCQYAQCEQISGAADSLFLTVDKALQKLPF